MTLILLATMKIIYTQEVPNLKLLSQQIQHYKTIILFLKNQHLKQTPQQITSAINVQTNSPSLTHCSQIIPFYDTSFFKYKTYFQGFFLPDDYSLDIN